MPVIRKVYTVECRYKGNPIPGDSFRLLKEARSQHKLNKEMGFFSAIYRMSYKRDRIA